MPLHVLCHVTVLSAKFGVYSVESGTHFVKFVCAVPYFYAIVVGISF